MNEITRPAMPSVVLLGAGSTLGRAMAMAFSARGHATVLAGRDTAELEVIATDIRVRYERPCFVLAFDAEKPKTHAKFLQACRDTLGDLPDGVVACFGMLPDESKAQADFSEADRCISVNFTGAVSILDRFAQVFAERGRGFIGGISSVAGDRGRQSNYHYGAAKAGFSVYLQGLRNRLCPCGVTVTTVKPGFMDTKMTYGMPLPQKLVADPAPAAAAAVRAIVQGKNVVYVPCFWQAIMAIIQHIPEPIFKRMRL